MALSDTGRTWDPILTQDTAAVSQTCSVQAGSVLRKDQTYSGIIGSLVNSSLPIIRLDQARNILMPINCGDHFSHHNQYRFDRIPQRSRDDLNFAPHSTAQSSLRAGPRSLG